MRLRLLMVQGLKCSQYCVKLNREVKNMTHDGIKRQSLNRFGAAFFALLAITEVLQYGTQIVLEKIKSSIPEHPAFLLVLSVAPLYFIALPVCIAILGKPRADIEPVRTKMPISRFLLAIVISFGVMFAGNLIGNLLSYIFALASGTEITNPLVDVITDSSPLLMFLTTVIIAPIGEELIFRRLIINHTRQ